MRRLSSNQTWLPLLCNHKLSLLKIIGVLVVMSVQGYFIYKDCGTITKWLQIFHGVILTYCRQGNNLASIKSVSLLKPSTDLEMSSTETLNLKETLRSFELEYRVNLAQLPRQPHNLSGTMQTGPPVFTNTITNSKTGSTLPTKKLLQWTTIFGEISGFTGTLCETKTFKCVGTRKKEELLTCDAVVFHARDLNALPQERLPNQRYIYYSMESPMSSWLRFRDYNGVFNWTATYMKDADFTAVYYTIEPRNKPLSNAEYSELLSNILHKKNSLVAARISNCEIYDTQRLRFVRELQRYIPVDFYGACGDLQCPKGKPECEDMSRYKFFLSFENSNCRDYITEKVRLPLYVWDAVPIVMGGSHPDDYLDTLPPNSYIHVKGFSSVKRLAQYLIFLDQNSQFYEKYHSWKKTYTEGTNNMWCDICRALHNDSMPIKIYSDFERWYDINGCVNGDISVASLSKITLLTLSGFVYVLNICV